MSAPNAPPTGANKIHNSSVIPVGYVDAGSPSTQQVSGGFYSLNKRSNVPFVKLVGSAGFQKTITWGEPTVVPDGATVTVFNASYHGGDIFLNKDTDPCNRPSRITVPVNYDVVQVSAGPARYVWKAGFPCDVRTSKRAYLMVDALATAVGLAGIDLYIRGRRLDGSMKSTNPLGAYDAPYGPGVGFINYANVPNLSQVNYIPLGQGAQLGDDTRPHNLLDAHDVFLNMDTSLTLADFLTWPAAAGNLPLPARSFGPSPATFYVVEYD